MLDFEWDEAKNASNRTKHGWDFSDAVRVFDDPFFFETEDRSADYGEMRMRVTGVVAERLVTVLYTERARKIHVISARRATSQERFEYAETRR